MNSQNFLFVFLLSAFNLSFKWGTFSIKREIRPPIKIQSVWTIDTVKEKILRPQLINNSPPLITDHFVVQGNSINGIKAYKKDRGQKVWDFKIQSGVASPVVLHRGNLYFGGGDGFFYSLQLETGRLNWKFFTGSENSSSPLIHEGMVYWTANNQKIYALTLKGKRVWVYSGPSLPRNFFVRGRPRPVVYKNWIYTGFYQGSMVALGKKTGRLKWKISLSPPGSIREGLEVGGNCLFVPVFNVDLFCLNFLNGKIRWKTRGGVSSYLRGKSVIYLSYKGVLYALRKFDGQILWKQKMKNSVEPLPVSTFKNYLVYGFPYQGNLFVASAKNGQTLSEYRFGRGLAAPVSIDEKQKDIYFVSVDGYLHKVSLLIKKKKLGIVSRL